MGSLKAQKGVCIQVGLIKFGNLGFLHKTRLEGDLETFTFGLMQIFVTMQPKDPKSSSKAPKRGPFPGLPYKSWGVLYKTEFESDPETFIGFMQLFDLTQPGVPVGLSTFHKSGVFSRLAK